MAPPIVLVLNAGSSSVKFAAYEAEGEGFAQAKWRGQVEGIPGDPALTVSEDGRRIVDGERLKASGVGDHASALKIALERLFELFGRERLLAAGHRVVHGGAVFDGPARIGAEVLAELDRLVPLAPLHQPHNIAGVRAVAEVAPELPQIACFDTSFHRTIPAVASTIALPRELRDKGLRRYGFHGISYSYIASLLPERLSEAERGRVVVAHLGNGASLCAMRDGRSVETTMGFSALDGLMMGTRCGSLDPGVLLYLLRDGYEAASLEELLYRRGGLLGLSGVSADMRAVLASDAPEARLAADQFVYRIVREVGALTSILGGLDALIFTAGIGERSAEIRARVCRGLEWLGVALDEEANEAAAERISSPGGKVATLVLPTDEERVIAEETLALVAAAREPAL
ncbi:acetate/propionate family kinase [Hansschlegelia zhihuaiae]|uniref:Acetate kinase n=1 Tax=Hansschlegelia zhihuaiae TaxID=405005 RepID=A0A4Q0MKV3_9HYPH|nr:acetate/propionate family kinase [Hansschlegelia zhihuaiae]RXF74270.1 acetate/propionate family kinase [Hansschlegelia zhihuaiae]